jgi:outer membrane protein assembly factor BamB
MRNRLSLIPLPATLALLGLLIAGTVTALTLDGVHSSGRSRPAETAAQAPKLTEWKLFGRIPERVHYLPADLNPPLKQVWSYNDQALIEFPPAIADGRIYVVNKYSNVRALDAGTGKVIWDLRRDEHYKGPPSDVTAPVFGREQVFAAFEDGTLVSLDAKTANVEWKRKLPTRLESSPLVIGKTLYIGSDEGTLFALDTANGKQRWTYPANHTIKASPSFDRGRIYFGDYGGAMFALDAKTGREIWRDDTQSSPAGGEGGFYSSPAVANGRIYAARDDGTVFAFDQRNGRYAWSFETGDDVYGSPAVADVPGTAGPTVYIGSYDKHLYAIDALSGKRRWRYDVGGAIPGTAVVIGHTVYTSSFATGKSIGIDVRTHRKTFSYASPGYTPMVSDGRSLYLVGYYSLHRLEPRR